MNKSKFSTIIIAFILTFTALLAVFPFYWMVFTSLRPADQIFSNPNQIFSFDLTFKSYLDAFSKTNMPLAYWNSIKIAGLLTIGTLFTSSLAAYAFAKVKFFGNKFVFGVFIATLLISGQVTMIHLYMVFSTIGWTDSHLPLIVPGILINTYGVFLLRQFMVNIPNELL